MYAHVMRKWSLIKLLMLLFLPIMILLFYCHGGVNAMYLSAAPRQHDEQHPIHYNPYTYTPPQQQQQAQPHQFSTQQNFQQHFQGVEEKRYSSSNNENSNRFLSESNSNIYYNNRKVDKLINHDSKNGGDENDDDSGEEEKKKNLLLLKKSDRNLIRSDNNLSLNNNNNRNSYVNEYNPHDIQKKLLIQRVEEKRNRHENFRHMLSRKSSFPTALSSSSSSSIVNQTEHENLNSISSHSKHNVSSNNNNNNRNSSNYRNRRDSTSRPATNSNSSRTNKSNSLNKIKRLRRRNQDKLHIKRHTKARRRRNRRYCSARDPATLAYEAPTVFSGKMHSMMTERSGNFAVTFEIKEFLKKQIGFIPIGNGKQFVRLQFIKTNKIECDIFKEEFRAIGYVNHDFEHGKKYYLFVNQTNSGNFTILGQPIPDRKNVTSEIKKGVSKTYGQNATIVDLRFELRNISATREHQIDANSKIRLVCKVRGWPIPKVTWYFKKQPVRDIAGYKVEFQRRRSILTVKHAQESNAGDYECRAKNKVSKKASRTIIIKLNQRNNTPNEEISGQSKCDVEEYCYNGGRCILFKQLSEYSCQCQEEYTGHRCQHKVPTDSNSTFPNTYDDDRLMPMTKMETSIPNDYYAEDVE